MALALIFILYASIGLLAAGGAIAFTSRRLSPRGERVTYGLLLVPIAAMYLAFRTVLSPSTPADAELLPALAFATLGLSGTWLTPLLILGYAGHGAWDLWHEVLQHQGRLGTLSMIPLAYGAFCSVFDWCVAGYAWTRRNAWAAA